MVGARSVVIWRVRRVNGIRREKVIRTESEGIKKGGGCLFVEYKIGIE